MPARKKKEQTLSEIVAGGSQLETLKKLAAMLANSLEDTGSKKEIASLSLRLIQTLRQIEELEPKHEETDAERIKREVAEAANKE